MQKAEPKNTVTGKIYAEIFSLLAQHPEGMRWADLARAIRASNSSFHPKTINGCIWKLPQKFPDQVYKPSKGLFRLI